MLKRLQKDFYNDVINNDNAKNYLSNNGFSANDLMQIYRNQYLIGLTQSLAKTYSCVNNLVGEGFFNTIARQFIKNHPAKNASIIEYGGDFAKFISYNENCKSLPYLSDVAKFERLYERCYFSFDLIFFMYSPYPIVEIWQLNQNSKPLNWTSGEVFLKIYKQDSKVLVEKITQQQYEDENQQTN